MKTIIIAIIMFLLLILVHEFGHFIIAKKSGIKVNEFAIGMGPKIFSTQKGETTYSINLFPIGGYCAMEGEDESSSDPRSFEAAPAYKRFLTILAGPVMNLLVAAIIFAVVFFNIGKPSTKIASFVENSPAQTAGIKENDEVVSIGGEKINEYDDISKTLTEYYKEKSKDKKVEVVVNRDGKEKTFDIKANFDQGRPMLGISPSNEKVSVLNAMGSGFSEVFKTIGSMFSILGSLFSGAISFSALSGPVGVVKELGNQASLGANNLLYFLAYISVNLGFFNLLPIPALDGSKIFTSLFEMITKKKVNRKIEERATVIGFVVLMGLIAIVTVKDIITIF